MRSNPRGSKVMNDFTKEELIEILEGLDDYYLFHSGLKIGEKIKSMIESYCEHEPDDFYYYRSKKKIRYTENPDLVPNDVPSFFKCKKCWEFF